MRAIRTDNLTKMFGHLVAVDHISSESVATSSQRWKRIEDNLLSGESRAEVNCEMLRSVAFGLPGMLHISTIIGSEDVEYQAYPWVNHS